MSSEVSLAMCDRCPTCQQAPAAWRERAKFGSREIYWIGCKRHDHVAGGVTRGAAIQSWNRLAVTIVYNRQQLDQLKRRIG